MLKKSAYFFLFGNYYLAFSIVALSVETAIKNGFLITDFYYYLFVFLSVVVYYTHAYIGGGKSEFTANQRSLWYYQNRLLIRITQIIFTIAIAITGVYLFCSYYHFLQVLPVYNWLLMLLFPFIALLYYGVIFPAWFRFRLRSIAWLKPFVVGFVCTGVIVIYPLLFHALQTRRAFYVSPPILFYFFTSWLYTTAIAIMFDIKDFAADHNYRLKTFVVTKGLRKTIAYILFPLSLASFFSFLFFAVLKHFFWLQIVINAIPFFLLLVAASSMQRRKGILHYLIVIDGLLFAKAAFGIAAMLLVK